MEVMVVGPNGGSDNAQVRSVRRKTRAYVNMHAQTENAGDALVLRELLRLVSARVPTQVYLGSAPDTFVDQLQLPENPAISATRGDATVSLVRDVVLARARGERCYYFLTAGAPNGERSLKQFAYDMLRLSTLAALTLFGVRVCQVGVSFENIGPRHRRVLRLRSRFLYASVPRDEITRTYMQNMGIRATGIMPDVTVNMFATPLTPRGQGRNAVAFSFRIDKYADDLRLRLCQLVREICDSTTQSTELIFIAQVARDVSFMRELAEVGNTARPGMARFVDCHRNIDQAFETYRRCGSVLSNRLHALLPCLKEGASPIAVTVPELDPKIVGVFGTLGLPQRIVDVRSTTADEIKSLMGPIDFDGSGVALTLNAFFDQLLETS